MKRCGQHIEVQYFVCIYYVCIRSYPSPKHSPEHLGHTQQREAGAVSSGGSTSPVAPLAPCSRPPGLLLQDVGHPLVAPMEPESLLTGLLAGK